MCIILGRRIDTPGTAFTSVKTAEQALVASFSSTNAGVIERRIQSEMLAESEVKNYETFKGLALIALAATMHVNRTLLDSKLRIHIKFLDSQVFGFTMKFLGA